MAECKECGTSIKAWEAIGGACEDCYSLYLKKKALLKEREAYAERVRLRRNRGWVWACRITVSIHAPISS